MAKKITKKNLIYFVLILAFVTIYLLGNRVDPTAIANTVRKAGIFGPIVYILAMASTFVIAPISGVPVTFAGYLLFGKQVQFLIYLAAIVGAVVNFWVARLWGRRLVVKFVGKENMEKVDEFTGNYGIKALIFLRLFQGNLFDFISYAFGLTKVKFLPYFIISALAPIPWLLYWYLFAFKYVNNLSDFTVWFLIPLIYILPISAFLYAKYWKKKQKLPYS